MIQIIYPVPQVPEDARSYSYRAPMPIRRACPIVAPPFLLNEGDAWNCTLCGADQEFFIPYLYGDILPFQTNFADNYNTNPAVLNAGIKTTVSADWYVVIELQDGSGTTISDLADTFCSTYYVAYSEQYGSVQNFFVNTGLFPLGLKCWRLKITYLKVNQITSLVETERVIYTEYHKEANECSSYVAIQSVYDTVDCSGNIYTLLENSLGVDTTTTYYNFLRFEGSVEFIGRSSEVTIETDRNKVIQQQLTKIFNVGAALIAPYFADMLHRVVSGSTVTVDGTEYKNFTFDKNNDASRMWVALLQFEEVCRVDNRGCNL